MKRPLSFALILGLLSFPAAGLVGCGEESEEGDVGNGHDARWDDHHDLGDHGQIDRREPAAQQRGRDRQDRQVSTSHRPPPEHGGRFHRPNLISIIWLERPSEHCGCIDVHARSRPWRRPIQESGSLTTMAINTQELQGQWNKLQGRVKEALGATDRRRPPDPGGQRRPARRPHPAEDRRGARGDREVPRRTDRARLVRRRACGRCRRLLRPPGGRPGPRALRQVGGHGPPQPGRGLRHRPGGRPDHRAGDPTPLSRARRFDGPRFVTDPRETIGTLRHAPELAEGNRYC